MTRRNFYYIPLNGQNAADCRSMLWMMNEWNKCLSPVEEPWDKSSRAYDETLRGENYDFEPGAMSK